MRRGAKGVPGLLLVLLALLAWLQYRLWVGEGSLEELRALTRETHQHRERLRQLSDRNRTLAAEVEDLRAGGDALEERARSELGMIQEGELFIQVLEPSDPTDYGS